MPQLTSPNRTLVGLALLTAVVGTLAQGARAEPFRGPYVGAEVGLDAAPGPDGFTYGGFAGWDFRLSDRIIVGPEFRISDSTARLDLDFDLPEFGPGEISLRSGRQLGASLRAGYLFRPDWLAFGRVGWENLRVSGEIDDVRESATDDSLTLGGGIEHALGDRWSIRATYDWVEGSSRHLVKLGAAFRF